MTDQSDNAARNTSRTMTPDEAFALARSELVAGRMSAAESILRQILAASPQHAPSLHLLGVALLQSGRPDEAVGHIRQSLSLSPGDPAAHANLGCALMQKDLLTEARAQFEHALAVKGDFAEAWQNLGDVQQKLGRLDESVASCRKALDLAPSSPAVHVGVACVLARQGRYDQAEAACRRALEIDPAHVAAWHILTCALRDQRKYSESLAAAQKGLALDPKSVAILQVQGGVLMELGEADKAQAAFARAVQIAPRHVPAWVGLASALRVQRRLEQALDAVNRALEIDPGDTNALNELGCVQAEMGQVEQAGRTYETVLASHPDHAEAHNNLGTLLAMRGGLDDAISHFERAVHLKGHYPVARFNRGLALLTQGRYLQAWGDYEWRDRCAMVPRRQFPQPRWDGGDLQGRRILLFWEQGFGDAIMFARYVPMVAARGGKAILEVQKPLARLLAGLDGATQVVADGSVLPDFDVQCPLVSLAGVFGTEVDTIPARVPYLHADERDRIAWRSRLGERRGLRVGLVWSANPNAHTAGMRCIKAKLLRPLWNVPGVTFYSLQLGEAATQVSDLPAGVVDLAPYLADFADTAAAMCELDLVISIDTAGAHLAGALARPTWTLLPHVADWRWLLGRDDSPWYPTMRLFRQQRAGDWAGVVDRVTAALAELAR